MTCSALKQSYRTRLRQASSGLQFVFMDITREKAQIRVAARAHAHIFPTALVDSQFATLESPVGESGVLRVDALAPLPQLQSEVAAWLASKETA
jgi:gluconokinase